jgi:tetratricopeptide (TPR) repeat protein
MVITQNDANNQTEVSDDMLDAFFAQAIERHQAEDWQAAEDFYRQVLAAIPEQPNANYNLGMLKLQINQTNQSLVYFKNALEADTGEHKYWVGYVEALIQAGKKNQAVEVLIKGVECGLHGEDIDALVKQLTQSTAPTSNVSSPIIVNASMLTNDMVSPQSNIGKHTSVILEEKTYQKSSNPNGINQYIDNPQIKKMLSLQQAGKLEQAKTQGVRLLKMFTNHPVILTCLGMIAIQQRCFDEGVKYLEQSLTILPAQTTALSILSVAYTSLNQLNSALRCAEEAIALNPNYAEAHANRGNVLKRLERNSDAIESYKNAIALQPNNAEAILSLGETLAAIEDYKGAAFYLRQGLLLKPHDIEAQCACGEACYRLALYDEALICLNKAIKHDQNNVRGLSGRGILYIKLKQFENALADFEQVIQLTKSKSKDAYLNLGIALHKLGRSDEAFLANKEAIKHDKRFVQAYNNQGLLLTELHRFNEAFDYYDQAIALEPKQYESYWNKALLALLTGDYKQGWQLYEYRWKSTYKSSYRALPKPLWLGDESLVGKKLLIHPEQGLGDYIQFCRYAIEVEKLGAEVILEVPSSLMLIVSTLKGNFKFIELGKPLPDYDFHCPILSLPHALKTEVETIPANIPYLFTDEQKKDVWQKRLGAQDKYRIGIAWSGSKLHINDQHRSIALACFKPLLSTFVELHVLQKEIKAEDMDTLKEMSDMHLHQEALHDFSDTAALIEQMDLVITVDTSVAHLAGAMGKECYLLIQYAPDFRWMLNRIDSPWYPSMTLFRQPIPKDWSSVIAAVRRQLAEKFD